MRYPVGQPVTITTTVRDADGQPADPATLLLQVRRPDGTTSTHATLQRLAIGEYALTLADAVEGHHQYAWSSTDPTGLVTGAFDVVDPFAPALLTLDDARAQLNKTVTSQADADELQLYVDTATEWVEKRCGAVAPRTVVETVTARAGRLWLGVPPVLAVVSATTGGAPVDVAGWSVPSPLAGFAAAPSAALAGDYTVTYRAGRSPIPAPLQLAARMLVAHLWETQRGQSGGPRPGGFDDPATAIPGLGFAVPNRVAELAAPYDLPAIA